MKLTQEQYEKIESYLPKQRENVSITNLQFLNALLYVLENGCKWRALPKEYGNWHTIYVRMNRWSKNGVLDRVSYRSEKQCEDILNSLEKTLDKVALILPPRDEPIASFFRLEQAL